VQVDTQAKDTSCALFLWLRSYYQTVLPTQLMYFHTGLDPPTPSTEQNFVPYTTRSTKRAASIETD
jgi:hypothetical protein